MNVIKAERIRDLMKAKGLSQSELARRVGVSQSAIHKIVSGLAYSSAHLHKVSRALDTSTEYLIGETDDPELGTPLPRCEPRVQHLLLAVAMPNEDALADMFEAQLRVFGKLTGAELARALAKRLPKALARLQSTELYQDLDESKAAVEGAGPLPTDRPAIPQAQRR